MILAARRTLFITVSCVASGLPPREPRYFSFLFDNVEITGVFYVKDCDLIIYRNKKASQSNVYHPHNIDHRNIYNKHKIHYFYMTSWTCFECFRNSWQLKWFSSLKPKGKSLSTNTEKKISFVLLICILITVYPIC